MQDVSCKLLSNTLVTDKIGVQREEKKEQKIPIIKVEDIYASEFYQANEQGYKPNLRLRISIFNYNGEKELIYMDTIYSIIRIQNPVSDEIVLVCERKLKNV